MIKKLFTILKDAPQDKKLLLISGSGVATFYKDFWNPKIDNTILNIERFYNNPEYLWSWVWKKRFEMAELLPTKSHEAIVQLENYYQENLVLLTNTIDGLHRKAGSYRLIEFRGNLYNHYPLTKKEHTHLNLVQMPKKLINQRGALLKPDITLIGEKTEKRKSIQARLCAQQADIVIILGSSLNFNELKSLPFIAKQNNNAKIIEINQEKQYCDLTDLFIQMPCDKVLPLLVPLIIDIEQGLKKEINNNF